MKKILLLSILLFSLMLIVVPVGYAGNPGPPGQGWKFVGPAIEGTITFIPGCNVGEFIAIFSGHCLGIKFALGPYTILGNLEDMTPELVEYQTLGQVGDQIPLECAPRKSGTEVRISNVTDFNKISIFSEGIIGGELIIAHVFAKFVVPK
jgi:hypothetical protein